MVESVLMVIASVRTNLRVLIASTRNKKLYHSNRQRTPKASQSIYLGRKSHST